MLKPFKMEAHKTIPKKLFVSEEQNYFNEVISLTPQDRIGNIDLFKYGS